MNTRISVLVVLLLTILYVTSCGNQKPSVIVKTNKTTNFDFSKTVTVGNHSYVSLRISGESADHVDEILAVLDGFERAHPELRITDWRIEERPASIGLEPVIFGLWIDHEPKPKG
jgi:hypothetical protein